MNHLLLGIRHNLNQVVQQLLQVLLVGMTVGMTRNVVPALAESEFGVPRGSFMLLVTFVVAFGLVKGGMNFMAGRLAEQLGRRKVLLLGWLVAWPIPLLIAFSTSWNWIVLATLLLGVNQGLTWSMTQTSALDFTKPQQRGLVIGLNEFAGYLGMALAGIATGYAATWLGARAGLMWFGAAVILLGTLLTVFAVDESQPWNQLHSSQTPVSNSVSLTTRQIFALMSWRDPRMMALSQAGLVEKFVDALVWMIWPIYLVQHGLPLTDIGWVLSSYGITWGVAQLATGYFSDVIGRHRLNWIGMWLCGVGVAFFPTSTNALEWAAAAAMSGLGMAMLYPNLSAAVADLAAPAWRASAIGIYRFWRDLGYAVGALGIGLTAHLSGNMDNSFWFVAISMSLSGSLLAWLGQNDHH
ncbi:MAG: MFS transporter [Limnohabitans sp.]|nr:MFS transporter [Limnohabitans sp.]